MDYQELQRILDVEATLDAIVNAPFTQPAESALLSLGICVLLISNPETGMIDRVALSNTELARNTTMVTAIPFNDIKIPASHDVNIIARAISSGEPQQTIDWNDMFTPALTPEEARLNQASAAIAYSAVYPLTGLKSGAAMIFSYYRHDTTIAAAQAEFMQQYAEIASRSLAQQVR